MTSDDRQLLEEIREQNLEILRLLRRDDIGDGGITVAMIAAQTDPAAAIRERNRQIKARNKRNKS